MRFCVDFLHIFAILSTNKGTFAKIMGKVCLSLAFFYRMFFYVFSQPKFSPYLCTKKARVWGKLYMMVWSCLPWRSCQE